MITIEQARQVLEDSGYAVKNLWHTDDVDAAINNLDIGSTLNTYLSEVEKLEVLYEALGSFTSDINEAIEDIILQKIGD